MAKRLAMEGCTVLLGGPVGALLKKKLAHSRLSYVTEGDDSVKEDVHVIMEYSKGEYWKKSSEPATRSEILRIIAQHLSLLSVS